VKILFLIRSLTTGGAERQLIELAKGIAKLNHIVYICVFYPGGSLETELLNSNINYVSLHKNSRWDVISFLYEIVKVYKTIKPDIVYSFQGPSCIVSTLVRFLTYGYKNVWGVRSADVDLNEIEWLARLLFRVECLLSRLADLIITNSLSGKKFVISNKFPDERTKVIHNGIDTERFKPNSDIRQITREEWNISDDEILIGNVARLDPMKDHPTFFRAAGKVLLENVSVRFVCVGSGRQPYSSEMRNIAVQEGISDKLVWAGDRSDMPSVYNALDILVLSSYTEGFPNVVAEAMACGTPCVVTDVGDSGLIVADSGLIVSPRKPDLLAEKILEMVRLNPEEMITLKKRARARIVNKFSMSTMVTSTLAEISRLK
jgi:glycosyltransferase involved in cell wall biosynthesis